MRKKHHVPVGAEKEARSAFVRKLGNEKGLFRWSAERIDVRHVYALAESGRISTKAASARADGHSRQRAL